MQVSLNAQNYSESEVLYTYYTPPVPLELCPSSGPTEGGTTVRITGEYFSLGSDYRVALDSKLNGTLVNTSIVRSVYEGGNVSTPPYVSMTFLMPPLPLPGSTGVRVSLNAQQYSRAPGVAYVAYPPPAVTRISPSCGPVDGATAIGVGGRHFDLGTHYMCHFTPQLVNATAHGHAAMACVAPPIPSVRNTLVAHHTAFEVTLNGQQYTSDGVVWKYTPIPHVSSIFPTAGVATGGVTITLVGYGFGSGCDLRCDFRGVAIVNATWHARSHALLCDTPPARDGTFAPVEITLNGQQYTSDGINVTYFEEPSIGEVRPLSTPLSGGTTVSLFGTGLMNYTTVACKFGNDTVVPATHVNTSQIRCATPPLSALSPPASKVGLEADFRVLPPELILGGNATVDGGVLKLTDANMGASRYAHVYGYAISQLASPMPALWDWRVSFELYIGGGQRGDGFSVLYGDLAPLKLLEARGGLTAYGDAIYPNDDRAFEGLQVRCNSQALTPRASPLQPLERTPLTPRAFGNSCACRCASTRWASTSTSPTTAPPSVSSRSTAHCAPTRGSRSTSPTTCAG